MLAVGLLAASACIDDDGADAVAVHVGRDHAIDGAGDIAVDGERVDADRAGVGRAGVQRAGRVVDGTGRADGGAPADRGPGEVPNASDWGYIVLDQDTGEVRRRPRTPTSCSTRARR